MLLRNSIIPNHLKDNLCLENFYTLEILESLGIDSPSQKQIDQAETTLASAKSISDVRLAPYLKINATTPDNAVLFIQRKQQISLAYQILFLNLGFSLDHFINSAIFSIRPLSRYKAIFIFDYFHKINNLPIEKLVNISFKKNQPFVCLVTDENNLTANRMNNFLKQNVQEILTFPLSFYKLRRVLEITSNI